MRAGGLNVKKRYGVFQLEQYWLLCCENQRLARFDERPAAISAGKRAACQALGSGFDAELYTMGVGGELVRIDRSSYGH